MKKIWAIICVMGFTAFWTYGLAIAAALFGERLFHPFELPVCLVGGAVGVYARWKLMGKTPTMHGKRASARARLDAEYLENAHG